MSFKVPNLLFAILTIALAALPASANGPFIEYQEVVTIEPLPGGGGGATCFLQITTRTYSNNVTEETVETVCI